MQAIIQFETLLGKYYGYKIDNTGCRVDDNSFYGDTPTDVYHAIRDHYKEDNVRMIRGWNM